ncbi:hypothetical protein GV829_08735 [Sphingomonas lacunae]|uniref:Uncharacterized protein n=1 Tax=Sphingomonas lacunae TaxID=2698828 RepID=A0A6M4ATY3_9SPHN|nr:hypothetical protein [Sphingomonas lacunae]QJQ32525.1 hypothetical protein GV829_08735 [Sphingomonas lacunae]
MKSGPAFALLAPAALMLGGCDWLFGAGSSADTQMTNVEILPGTASDEMITLDQASGDGTAIDTSVEVRPGEPDRPEPPEDATEDNGDEPAADDASASAGDAQTGRPGDTVIRPPAEPAKR